MILESAKKLELSVNEATNSTYQIRPKKYLKEVGHQVDKVHSLNSNLPIGIQPNNKYR